MADLKSQGQNVAETKLYADIDFLGLNRTQLLVTLLSNMIQTLSDVQLEISF